MKATPAWYQQPAARPGHSVVIGGGIAGCSIAYALNQLGMPVSLIERHTVASGASANTRAVLRPHLVRSGELLNHFNETAFATCKHLLAGLHSTSTPVEYALPGVLQLIDNTDSWPAFSSTYPVDAEKASRLANIPLQSGALYSPTGGWVNMRSYCRSLLNACRNTDVYTRCEVTRLLPKNRNRQVTWQVDCKKSETEQVQSLSADNVIIANGPALQQFSQTHQLPLTISAGQTTRCTTDSDAPHTVITGKRYLIADATHCTVGATHHRIENVEQAKGIDADEENNANLSAVSTLKTPLTDRLTVTDHWRGLRGSTPDRLPMAGAIPDLPWFTEAYEALRHGPRHQDWAPAHYYPGLYTLTGLGSRGVVTSALCARLLGGIIKGDLSDSDARLVQLLHPARFLIRGLQRSS